MYPSAQRLQTRNVAGRSAAIVLLGLSTITSAEVATRLGQYLLDILLLDGGIYIDIVRMEDLWIVQWLQKRSL